MTTDLIPARHRGTIDRVIPGILPATMEPSTARGDVMLMSWVDENDVPETHRAYVRRHTDRAGHRHNLGHISIRWFGPPVNGGDFWGVAAAGGEIHAGLTPWEPGRNGPDDFPMTIALNAGLRGPIVKAVIAHEVRHVAQNEALARLARLDEREADADAFAVAYIDEESD